MMKIPYAKNIKTEGNYEFSHNLFLFMKTEGNYD